MTLPVISLVVLTMLVTFIVLMLSVRSLVVWLARLVTLPAIK